MDAGCCCGAKFYSRLLLLAKELHSKQHITLLKCRTVIISFSSCCNSVHLFFRTAQEWSYGRRGGSCCPTYVSSTTEVSPAASLSLSLSLYLSPPPSLFLFSQLSSSFTRELSVRGDVFAIRVFDLKCERCEIISQHVAPWIYVSWQWDLLRPWLLPWKLKRNCFVALSSEHNSVSLFFCVPIRLMYFSFK